MVILISGATHSGKTVLMQRLIERFHYPALSLDHLKMGLIRSGETTLTPSDDDKLTDYLWPIAREMIKTAIENDQHLIVEGLYIPPDWRIGFSEEYLPHVRYICLVMTEDYIRSHYADIVKHRHDVEHRGEGDEPLTEELICDHESFLHNCREYGDPYVLIDRDYEECVTDDIIDTLLA